MKREFISSVKKQFKPKDKNKKHDSEWGDFRSTREQYKRKIKHKNYQYFNNEV